ncbi:hypothetical protein PG993_007352 [Apiospora rasikravindrae]|uniref:Ankyrin n=1 Tax=Apiospora rasikravindrae TaxID=990691 RepID=A0ABR1SX87_9PEZI
MIESPRLPVEVLFKVIQYLYSDFFHISHLFAPFAARVLYNEQGTECAPSSLLHRVLDKLGVAPNRDERLKTLAILYRQACDCVQTLPQPSWSSSRYPFTGTACDYSWVRADRDQGLRGHLIPAAILLGIREAYENVFTFSTIVTDDVVELMTQDSEHFGTPLYAAVTAHQNELALALLSWMKRANRRDSRDLLRATVISNNVFMLQQLLQSTQCMIRDKRISSREALVEAAKLGYADIASCLFSHARDVYPDMIDTDLLSESVHYASLYGHIDYLEVLVRQGDVDLEARPCERRLSRATPLMIAAWRGNTELLQWLLRRGACSRNSVLAAIDGDEPEALRILYEAGIGQTIPSEDADAPSEEDWNEELLLRAFLLDSHKTFRYLLIHHKALVVAPRHGPEPNDYWMAKACAWGKLGIFEALLDVGVPLHAPLGVTPGWTAMHFALASSVPTAKQIVRKMLDMGAPKPNQSGVCQSDDAVDGFREGVLRPDFNRYWSGMPFSTQLGFSGPCPMDQAIGTETSGIY